jgi:HNH endonuclease
MTQIFTYRPVGTCIYCGSDGGKDGLRDEHIVPFSLGGQSILPKASCWACERVTSAFEGSCARTMYGSFRIRENVQTRRPKERPSQLPVIATTDGEEETVMMPVEGVVAIMPWVHFLPPGIFRDPPVKEVGWTGATLEVKSDQPRDNSVWGKHKGQTFSFMQKFDVDALARTLAKIAHAIAIGELGINAFEHWLPPDILGADPALSYLVGSGAGSLDPTNVLHEIKWTVGHWPHPRRVRSSLDHRLRGHVPRVESHRFPILALAFMGIPIARIINLSFR